MARTTRLKAIPLKIGGEAKRYLLEVFLRAVYFGFITPYSLVWRLLGREKLKGSRAQWVRVQQSSDTPDLFERMV